jgi:predicted enzyme related to lactoylglutathione lyase
LRIKHGTRDKAIVKLMGWQLAAAGGIMVFHYCKENGMIKGLRTVSYPVTDLARAKDWYAEVFGTQPYFDQPYYAGFAVGGFELGLVPDGTPGSTGAVAYWAVDDIEADVKRIVGLGAGVREAVKDVGGGIRVADLLDPFGNVIGLIENPHFDPEAVR